ncbi:ABC transporter permease subunit [Planctopirus hydrillae]|uniref:ABC transporter permease subunit n=1 Tax=Planctopirus hydrillae TaxID=1841610 RepID=UPI0009F2A9E7|nr:ABC transporter permease subunit [Planctopirus hydrillae]
MVLMAASSIELANQLGNWVLFGIGTLIVIGGLLAYSYGTKGGIIARATTKEAVRQPVFWLSVTATIVFLLINTWLPFFSLGEDLKMLKECGLTTILICGLLIATWTASTSIADEIEGKTAMTLLSKPITRRQFILGKYIGILQTVLLYMIPVSIVFGLLIFYKVGYDARESSKEIPTALQRLPDVIQMFPGLVLTFLEVAILGAISVAISTRLPFVVNMAICFPIYVIGNLTPQLVQAGAIKFEFVAFMAKLISIVLPGLEWFNMSTAISTGTMVPPIYLATATLYALCYIAASILLAFILFEDRDLA